MLHLLEISNLLIWSFFAGICFALIYAYYVKHVIGSLVRFLIDNKCFSIEDAKKAPEMNALDKMLLNFALRKNSSVYDIISVSDDDKYYITENKKEKARKKYKGDVRSVHLIIAIVALFAAALLIQYFFDNIVEFMDGMVQSVIEGFKSIGRGTE